MEKSNNGSGAYTPEQYNTVKRMKEDGVLTSSVNNKIEAKDLREMYKYAKLGQEYESAIRHYDSIRGFANAYLGALYVGVDEDSESLLSAIRAIHTVGLQAEDEIDKVKQVAAFNYLYDANIQYHYDGILTAIWNYFGDDLDRIFGMSAQELQFWWELIPSSKYVSTGTEPGDVLAYLTR